MGVTRPRRFSSLGSAEMRNPGFVGKTGHEPVAKGYIALSPLKVSCQPLQVESRHLPQSREINLRVDCGRGRVTAPEESRPGTGRGGWKCNNCDVQREGFRARRSSASMRISAE